MLSHTCLHTVFEQHRSRKTKLNGLWFNLVIFLKPLIKSIPFQLALIWHEIGMLQFQLFVISAKCVILPSTPTVVISLITSITTKWFFYCSQLCLLWRTLTSKFGSYHYHMAFHSFFNVYHPYQMLFPLLLIKLIGSVCHFGCSSLTTCIN